MPSPRALKQLCGVAALLLAVSAGVNIALAKALYDSFIKLHFARIFPLGYVPKDQSSGSTLSYQPTISFWGDSRAYLWEKSALASYMTVHDHSHGGTTSSQLLLSLLTQPITQTDFAVVQIGINDLHPLGGLQVQRNHIIESLRQNILAVRDALLARSKIVVLTTLIPPGRIPLSRRITWDPATLQHISEINEIIRRAADGNRVLVLDAHSLLSDSKAYLADRFADPDFFLHVNRDAYLRLNDQLQQLLRDHRPASRN